MQSCQPKFTKKVVSLIEFSTLGSKLVVIYGKNSSKIVVLQMIIKYNFSLDKSKQHLEMPTFESIKE